MKVVINTCYGGFSLSPKAVHWLAARKKRPCYFFVSKMDGNKLVQTPCKGYPDQNEHFWTAFDVSEFVGDDVYDKHVLNQRPEVRHDPELVQVVEELGEEANGSYSKLKVVDIPDGVEYTIEEYDGIEHVAEVHRTWS